MPTRVTRQQRERGIKKNKRSALMPYQQGWHVHKDKRVLRKVNVWHSCHVNKDKGVLREWREALYVARKEEGGC